MRSQSEVARSAFRWRAMLWSMLAIIALAMALPSVGYLVANAAQVYGPDRDFTEERATNPRSDMWRDARVGQGGFTTQTGPYITNTMISNIGENYRQLREGPIKTWGGWFLVLVIVAIALFAAINGRSRLEEGRSGMTVERWKTYERILHWFTAISFIVLTITGLSLLFGRTVLIPMFGHTGFATYAQFAMNLHNALGPFFAVGVILMILLWAKHNIPSKTDVQWFRQGGGIIGSRHPSAGKLNGGEKLWFWLGVFAMGLIVIISGFIMLFPNLGFQTREIMAWSQIFHAVVALIWIGFFFGHAYIGTLGTEGAFEGMAHGRVDTNWAKQHHDLWYEEVIVSGEKPILEEELRRQKRAAPAGGEAPGH